MILSRGNSLHAPLDELSDPVSRPASGATRESVEDAQVARIVKKTLQSLKETRTKPTKRDAEDQRQEIERVLRETDGRVGGADGAAARMGINRTTLLSRMKKLKIGPYAWLLRLKSKHNFDSQTLTHVNTTLFGTLPNSVTSQELWIGPCLAFPSCERR